MDCRGARRGSVPCGGGLLRAPGLRSPQPFARSPSPPSCRSQRATRRRSATSPLRTSPARAPPAPTSSARRLRRGHRPSCDRRRTTPTPRVPSRDEAPSRSRARTRGARRAPASSPRCSRPQGDMGASFVGALTSPVMPPLNDGHRETSSPSRLAGDRSRIPSDGSPSGTRAELAN